jgi:hypothetical protein
MSRNRGVSVTYRCRHLKPKTKEHSVTNRQEKVPGFNQQALAASRIILVGAGGLGGEIGVTLTRKGIGELVILDNDIVEPTNLNRQKFYKSDLYKNKAIRLSRNLAKEGFNSTSLQGIALSFQDALDAGFDLLEMWLFAGWTTTQPASLLPVSIKRGHPRNLYCRFRSS